MSELQHHSETDPTTGATGPSTVEVRRNAGVALGVGAVASVVAILYLSRATGSGAWLDWTLCAVMGLLAAAYLQAFVDARTPLLVADALGVRVRQGRTWRGMPWQDVEAVEHLPRAGALRDGRLEVYPLDGDPVTVPLSLSTRVVGADGDLTGTLRDLAGDVAEVVEVYDAAPDLELETETETEAQPARDHVVDVAADRPAEPTDLPPGGTVAPPVAPPGDAAPRRRDPRPALASGIGRLAARLRLGGPAETAATAEPEPRPVLPAVAASATPTPLRDPVTAARVEVRSDLTVGATALRLDPSEHDGEARGSLPEARELRRPGSVDLVEDTVVWGDRVTPIAREGSAVEPLVIDDLAAEPAEDPVVGPELAAARTRLGLTVDQLADRTRIRPHVIESIEVDDFAPCGGDFYARGHLRTLARVLGVDVAPLLASYDERYADAPISPRRVFEAELATGAHGGIRGTRGGPNWSVLVAAVMVLVLAWSVARLVMDRPVALNDAPTLNGSPGRTWGQGTAGAAASLVLDASGGGAHVTVVDGRGEKVFDGDLAFGQTKALRKVVTPVEVTSSDGSLRVALGDQEPTSVGETGERARRTYVVR